VNLRKDHYHTRSPRLQVGSLSCSGVGRAIYVNGSAVVAASVQVG
jgi:hypothetical protein